VASQYNRLVGTVRVEVERVDGVSCPWRAGNWEQEYRIKGEENNPCYPALLPATVDVKPFGPWYDPVRYRSQRRFGQERYTFELSDDEDFAAISIGELVGIGFFDSKRTRSVRLALSAAPAACRRARPRARS
jgi:hypothetical protein